MRRKWASNTTWDLRATRFADGHHMISYDRVVEVMKETGKDIPSLYRETSEGGLARNYTQK